MKVLTEEFGVGERFGRLTNTGLSRPYRDKGMQWHCLCECGEEKWVLGYKLRNEQVRSCGCLQRDTARETMHLKRQPVMLYNEGIDF